MSSREGDRRAQDPLNPDMESEAEAEAEETVQEEAEEVKVARDPGSPTKEELEEHRITHYPFRSWCPHCVAGRATGPQHVASGDSHAIPVVAMDYFYCTKDRLLDSREARDQPMEEMVTNGQAVKCLLVRCTATKNICAFVVQKKGVDDMYSVERVVNFVRWLGHGRIIMRADNEPALGTVMREAVRSLKVEVVSASDETSAAYDSQSNGAAEVGIKIHRGIFRTMRDCLECRVQKIIEVDRPIMAWLVEHAAMVASIMSKGNNGRTPWYMARGRSFGMRMVGFGEICKWKLPTKGPQRASRGNMRPWWENGIFLGYSLSSNEYLYANTEGVVCKSRAVQRLPMADRWNATKLAEIAATPWSRHTPKEASANFPEERIPSPDATAPKERQIRNFRITSEMIQKYGLTDPTMCPQCDHIARYNQTRPGTAHSQACRQRYLDELAKDPEGQATLQRLQTRLERSLAESVERAEPAKAQESPVDAPRNEAMANEDRRIPDIRGDGDPGPVAGGDEPMEVRDENHGDGMDIDNLVRSGRSGKPLRDEVAHPARDPPSLSWRPTFHEVTSSNATDASGGRNSPPPADETGMSKRGDEARSICLISDAAAELLVTQLGGHGGGYARERRQGWNRMVSEIYSPPRITSLAKQLPSYGILPGFALDLTTVDDQGKHWDFNKKLMRDKARRLIKEERPMFLVGSPMCTAFTTWQVLNEQKHNVDQIKLARARVEATMHMNFVTELYCEQVNNGRFFLHEHPAMASSWQLRCMKNLMSIPGVERVVGDQCQYGQSSIEPRCAGYPVKKPTGWLSNSKEILRGLDKRCTGKNGMCSKIPGQMHAPCSGRTAKGAAKYSRELCKAILGGMRRQLKALNMVSNDCYGMQHSGFEEDEVLAIDVADKSKFSGRFRDDITGQLLQDDLVLEARKKELAYFAQNLV